ncbi:MAG: response regulator transcription factor [Nitrosomonas sp.]|jgi:DNA-binding NarL/FixJ family response regulator
MRDNPLILLIEDEKALRENICEIITHYGFQVTASASGEEGIRIVEKSEPDIIICDIMLPGIDGHEVLTTVREQLPAFTGAFIFLTAKSTRADTRAGMDMGADDYLTKPFTKEELINSIKARIEKLAKIQAHNPSSFEDTLAFTELEKIALLTQAERKVIRKISEGLTTPQIAQKLFLSQKTIENHRTNISRKLNLSGPNSLINFALRLKPSLIDSH